MGLHVLIYVTALKLAGRVLYLVLTTRSTAAMGVQAVSNNP